MAKKPAAWGIDIGLYALKAVRCRAAEDGTERLVAEAFDFIEYPKPLSEAGADPVASIKDALRLFLSRNRVKKDKIVISVPGQAGLARFIKLPPVEAKKIPDIVKYEARQQIPFPLDEVVWDYQQMGAGGVEDGFALDCEVGLFAMKRDQVQKALQPFIDADVEVDVVQLSPIALYNMLVFDQLRELPPPDQYDPENPPESTVLLSIGTETTDFVVTNGYKMWQRNLPVGGNHFTRALVKELKLNHETAEHLKRNASKAQDPKALFQAMRPVFGDLLTEVERSLKFYANVDKTSKIGRIVACGNAVKLPGLQRFLTQNLGFDIAKLDSFRGLTGTGVVDAPAFKENQLSYGVCYGLCLQGLSKSKLKTNLLPREITQYRMIRAKKPWALTAAALLLVGLGFNYSKHFAAMKSAMQGGPEGFKAPVAAADKLVGDAKKYKDDYDAAQQEFHKTYRIGNSFLQNVQGRRLWLETMWVVNNCLPTNPPSRPVKIGELNSREDLKITNFECRRVNDLSKWYAGPDVAKFYEKGLAAFEEANGRKPGGKAAPAAPADPNAAPADPNAVPAAPAADPGPTGAGWVFEMQAHHYFNHRQVNENLGMNYVYRTFLQNVFEKEFELPAEQAKQWGLLDHDDKTTKSVKFTADKLGISYPVLKDIKAIDWNNQLEVEDLEQRVNPGEPPARKKITVPKYELTIQFVWQEKLPADRLKSTEPPGVAAAGAPK